MSFLPVRGDLWPPLDFFYTGHLALTSGNRDQVLLAARELRVPEAVELCQSFQPKASVGQASSGQSGPGNPASQDADSHLEESMNLEEEEGSRTLGLVPRDQEPRDSHSPERLQLSSPAKAESPSFLHGKLKQAVKPCPAEDKEPDDCECLRGPWRLKVPSCRAGVMSGKWWFKLRTTGMAITSRSPRVCLSGGSRT